MLLAHKIALEPTAQRWYFARAAGTARFAWNWGAGRMAEAISGRRQAVRCFAPARTE
jgi:Helix-turn-helix domain